MSLNEWERNGWLKRQATSRQEIGDLKAIVERDLRDAHDTDISDDWRFGIAYNACLKLCTILLRAEGYRPVQSSAHYRTLAALPFVLGDAYSDDADYLETCRRKRNAVEYDRVGCATKADADELIRFGKQLQESVNKWLRDTHPDLT